MPCRAPFLPPRIQGPLRAGLLCSTALLSVAVAVPAAAQSPQGGQVTAGSAAISQAGNVTRVQQSSNRAVVDWRRFDVGRNHAVEFNQPSAASWTLNRVNSPDPSTVAGRISANGGVAIVNQSGVTFAPGAQVNVGSLIASASNISNENFMAGRMVFDGPPRPGARVENHGSVTVAERGLAALVGPGVTNSGTIRARLGRVALAGAETFTLDLAGDGMVALDVTGSVRRAPDGATALVTNTGVVEAAGGTVVLSADAARGAVETLVRNTGRVSADATGGTRAGSVALRGSGGNVRVDGGSVTARGRGPGVAGGSVEVTASGGAASVAPGARVSASGAAGGGTVLVGGPAATVAGRVLARGTGPAARGGRVEVNAAGDVAVAATGRVDASGAAGGGTALIGTGGIGPGQTMAARTTVARGAEVRADATGAGRGGTVAVNSSGATDLGGLLSARGGPGGGDGGFIELSGGGRLTASGNVDVRAPLGTAGTLYIDPVNLTVRDTPPAAGEAAGDVSTGVYITDGSAAPGDPVTAVVTTAAVAGFAGTVRLEATNDLTVESAIVKTNGGLTFVAGHTISINAPITLTAAAGDGAVSLTAGNAIGVNADITLASTAAGADVVATAPSIVGGGRIAVGDGRTISLRAENLADYAGALDAGPGGLVEIGPRTAGAAFGELLPGAVRAGAVRAPGLLTAGTVRIGQTGAGTAGAVTIASPLDTTGAALLQVRGTSLNAASFTGNAMDLETSGGVVQVTTLNAAAVRASGSAGVSFTTVAGTGAGGAITLAGGGGTGSFVAAFTGGTAVTLGSVAGQTGIGASGDVSLKGAGSITLAAPVAASGAVTLTATGQVAQAAAGKLTAASVDARGSVVALDAASNEAGTISGAATGDFRFSNAGDLTADGITAGTLAVASGSVTITAGGALTVRTVGSLGGIAAGDVTLTAASIRLEAPVAAVGTARLTGPGGVSQDSAGALTAGAARIDAYGLLGQVSLGAAANAVGTLSGGATGGFSFSGTGELAIGSAGGATGIGVGALLGSISLASDSLSLAAGAVGAASVDLTARAGGIGTAAGSVAAGSLRARATGGSVALTGANEVGFLSGEATGDFTVANAGTMTVSGVLGTSGVTAGGTATLSAASGTLTIAAPVRAVGGAVSLAAPVLQIAGDVTAGTEVALAADALALTAGRVTAAGGAGTVTVSPYGTGTAVTLGGLAGSGLVLTTGFLNGLALGLSGGTLVVDAVAKGGAVGTGASLDLAGLVRNLRLRGTTVTLGNGTVVQGTLEAEATAGDVTGGFGGEIRAGRLIASATADGASVVLDEGTLRVGSVAGAAAQDFRLSATGDLTIGPGGIAAANGLVQIGSTGTMTVSGAVTAGTSLGLSAAGDLTLDAAASAGAAVSLRGDTGLTGAADLSGTTARLRSAGGAILQTGGAISAGSLSAVAGGGNVSLTGAGNAIGLAAGSGGSFALVNGAAAPLTIGTVHGETGIAATGPFGTVSVTSAGALTLAAGVTGPAIDLRAAADDLTQTAGTVAGGTLRARADAGAVALSGPNEVGFLAGAGATGFSFRDASGFATALLGGTDGVSAASGDVSLSAASGILRVAAPVAAAAGDVSLSAPSVALEGRVSSGPGATAIRLATDNLTSGAGGAVATDAAAGTILLAPRTAGRTIILGGGPGDGTALVLDGDTIARLGAAALLRVDGGADSAIAGAGPVDLTTGRTIAGLRINGATIDLGGPVSAGGLVDLAAAAGDLSSTGGIAADRLVARAPNGAIAITGPNAITAATDTVAFLAAGSVTFQAAGGFQLGRVTGRDGATSGVTGTALTLFGGGDVTQSAAGVLTGTSLLARSSGGSVLLENPDNAIGSGSAPGIVAGRARGDLRLVNLHGTVVGALGGTAGIAAQLGAVSLTAPTLTLNRAVAAGGPASLTATGGSLVLNAALTAGPLADLSAIADVAGTAAALVSAAALRARAGGSVLLDAAPNGLSAGGGAGTIAGSAGGDFRFANAGDLAVGSAGSPATTGIAASGGLVSLSAASLSVEAPVTAGTAVALSATSGDLGVAAVVGAGTDLSLSAGRDVVLGAGVSANGSADLLAGRNVAQSAGGAVTAAALRARAGGEVALGAAANAAGTISGGAGGGFAYATPGALSLSEVLGTAGITAGTGGIAITAGPLGVDAPLDAGGVVTLVSTGVIRLGAPVAGRGGADLTAAGDVSQSAAGVLTTPGLRVRAGGNVALADGPHAVAVLAGQAGGTFAFRAAGDLDIGTLSGTAGLSAGAGGIAVATPGLLSGAGPVATPGAVALSADRADLAGPITGETLGLAVAGDLTLTGEARIGGRATLTADSASLGGPIAAGSLTAVATGALSVTGALRVGGAGAADGAGASALAAERALALGDASPASGAANLAGATVSLGAPLSAGSLSVVSGGALSLDGPMTVSGAVSLSGGTVGIAAPLSAGSVSARSGGALTVGAPVSASGGVTLAGATVTLDAPVAAGTVLDLLAADRLVASGGGVLTAPSLRAWSEGDVSLTAANVLGTLAGRARGDFAVVAATPLTVGTVLDTAGIAAGGTVALTAPSIGLAGGVSGNVVRLTSTLGDLGGGGAVTAGVLTGRAAGAIRLDGPNAVGTVSDLEAVGGTLSLRLAGPARITGFLGGGAGLAVSGAGDIVLSGATVAAPGGDASVSAAGALGVTGGSLAAGGTASLGAGGAATLSDTVLTGTGVTVAAGGGATLSRVTALAAGPMRLTSGGSLRVESGRYDADRLVAAAGGPESAEANLSFSGTAFRVGTGVLFAAGGGIGRPGDNPSSVRARDPAALPLVILDVRRSPTALRDLPSALDRASTDRPGAEPRTQPWQVDASLATSRFVFGRDDATPGNPRGSGLATGAAAGPITLALDADSSPVFLLLNAATVTGDVTAGRIGVLAQPGPARLPGGQVVNLNGQLLGIGGSAAAQYGSVSFNQPVDRSLFRFNDCVISALNCIVIPVSQPAVRPLENRIEISAPPPLRLDPDVIIPNVSDEDE